MRGPNRRVLSASLFYSGTQTYWKLNLECGDTEKSRMLYEGMKHPWTITCRRCGYRAAAAKAKEPNE